MGEEIQLRRQAREAIREGKLPGARPERVWGGPGSGGSCAVCGKPVTPDQTGFELEFASQSPSDKAPTHVVHIRCLAAWELERGGSARDANRSANGHLNGSRALGTSKSNGVLPERLGDGTMTDGERQTDNRRGSG